MERSRKSVTKKVPDKFKKPIIQKLEPWTYSRNSYRINGKDSWQDKDRYRQPTTRKEILGKTWTETVAAR